LLFPKIPARQAALVVVGLAFFTDALVYAMLPPLLPEYARLHGLDQSQLGLLFGAYAAALLLATLPLGAWVDRSGRRGAFLGGLIGFGVATLLFAGAGSFALLMLARMFQGVAAAATWVAGMALLADHFPDQRRGQAMGTVFACSNLGLFLGPALAGWMTRVASPRSAFLLVAGLALLDALARLVLLPRGESGPPRPGSGGYRALLRDGPIRVLAGVMGLGALLGATMEALLPLRLAGQLGMGAGGIGLAFTGTALATMLGTPLVGRWTDRLGPGAPLRLGLALGAALFLLAPFLSSPAAVCAFMPALGCVCSLLMAPCGPALARRVQARGGQDYGSVFSLLNITFSMGIMTGPVAGSILAEHLGLGVTMALFAAGFLLYLVPLAKGIAPAAR